MSKKLYAAFLPLFAVAAFAVLPAAAQAQVPHWYSCQAKAGGTYENSVCTKTGAGKLFEMGQNRRKRARSHQVYWQPYAHTTRSR